MRRFLPTVRNGSPSLSAGGTWEARAVCPREPQRQVDEPVEKRESCPERWTRWKRMLDSGEVRSRAELARVEGVSRAAVTLGLRKLSNPLD